MRYSFGGESRGLRDTVQRERVGEVKSEVRLEGCEQAEGGPGGVHGTHKSPTGVAGGREALPEPSD